MPDLSPISLLIAFFLALVISGAAKAVRALSWSGMVAATFVGFSLFGFAGWRGAAALLLFFTTSTALSRLGKKRKAELLYEKGGERDAGQVLANGGIAALCAFLLIFFPGNQGVIAALLGSLAAANADTWATEIGSLAKGKPVRITNWQPTETGESGAISLPGTLASLAGAALSGTVALLWGLGVPGFLAVTLGGFAGSLFDSLLGATVQAQYRDAETGRLTERPVSERHQPNPRVRGVRSLNNDAVNAFATLCGAVMAMILQRLLSR